MTTDFDIAPFALPNTEPNELRFEDPRDITEVVVTFKRTAPGRIRLSYLRKAWPESRAETRSDSANPCSFGWITQDDQFNGEWQAAAIRATKQGAKRVALTFRALTNEFPAMTGYDMTFRRTLGIKLHVPAAAVIADVAVHTRSPQAETRLRIELNAGRKTPTAAIRLRGHNAVVAGVSPSSRVTTARDGDWLLKRPPRQFTAHIRHMNPCQAYSGDDPLLTFDVGRDAFTISLTSLAEEGPIWFDDKGIFITAADDPIQFEEYRARHADAKTLTQRVLDRKEQSLDGAYYEQPRAHVVCYNVGVKHARQRFTIEPNGDVLLVKNNVKRVKGKDTDRFKNDGDGRFFFGLESWRMLSRFPDPAPTPAWRIQARKGGLTVEQQSLAVPLDTSILKKRTTGDDTVVALIRFRFTNTGDAPVDAELPVQYSAASRRSHNAYGAHGTQNDAQVPISPREALKAGGDRIWGQRAGHKILRAAYKTDMRVASKDKAGILLTARLEPGASCEALLKIPFIALDKPAELKALSALTYEKSASEVAGFWKREVAQGAEIRTPEPRLNELHAAHLTHVQISDFEMPDGSGLINTSVGTSTYGNFSNESCMIVQELDQRGFHDDARRRLELWIKYQGTVEQPGNFTDYDGMYYGAGGFESGHYNQHHGWVLWCLCEHFFLTRDAAWLRRVADSVIAGADWISRQRRNTMKELPHSRGWEYGFLPAGSLEDVTDFYYWLSTNALTWRGADHAARALAEIGHPEADRLRGEADRYRHDLIRGFETMRQHSPLVRLRDGRWIPHYPSRLYRRGRDVGWIREVLEGAVYLLLSGLYDSTSKQAGWILDDYQDNRYMAPPYGYLIPDFESNWFSRGGFSIQPNLLAGLLPYLDRDEPEQYIRMFFNAWCACYREEIGGMSEHPMPVLGFSNSAQFKTSDEANAVMWLRYLYLYWNHELLHIGRALPRAWLSAGNDIAVTDVATYHGAVSARYSVDLSGSRIKLECRLDKRAGRARVLARFRHPEKTPIKAVHVNGKRWTAFNPATEDVDLTGLTGKIVVDVVY